MKTIEKEFVNQLKELLDESVYNEQNNYFVNRLIDIFNNTNMESINLINLKDFSILLDYFNYEGYNRGLLIIKVLINNFQIIDSKPYSKINFHKYHDIYEKRNISFEQFIIDVRNIINSKDLKLDKYRYDIYKMLQTEENDRLNKVKNAKEIKKAYENFEFDKIINYLISINLNEKDIIGTKLYLNTLKDKKTSIEKNISMDLKIKPIKLGYTNKEIKDMDKELNNILTAINEKDIKITYQDYLKYVKYVLILEKENKSCDADIERLYEALNVNKELYSFLKLKSQSMLQTNKAIDIENTIQDINDVESILASCDE